MSTNLRSMICYFYGDGFVLNNTAHSTKQTNNNCNGDAITKVSSKQTGKPMFSQPYTCKSILQNITVYNRLILMKIYLFKNDNLFGLTNLICMHEKSYIAK